MRISKAVFSLSTSKYDMNPLNPRSETPLQNNQWKARVRGCLYKNGLSKCPVQQRACSVASAPTSQPSFNSDMSKLSSELFVPGIGLVFFPFVFFRPSFPCSLHICHSDPGSHTYILSVVAPPPPLRHASCILWRDIFSNSLPLWAVSNCACWINPFSSTLLLSRSQSDLSQNTAEWW